MTIARWTDERLDQLADDVDNLRGSVADLRATAEIMLQTQIQHQQNFEVVVSEIRDIKAEIRDIKAEIRGLQLENRRILEEMRGIEPDKQSE